MSDTTRRLGGLAAASFVALALGACAQTKETNTADSTAAEVAVNDGLNATYWTQKAVEFKANSYALYALAKLRLDQELAGENWTAMPGQSGTGNQEKPTEGNISIAETLHEKSE